LISKEEITAVSSEGIVSKQGCIPRVVASVIPPTE
jgi:hypothetical protein